MNILFIHQNMPGQYKHLAAALARDPGNRVVFVTRRADRAIPGVHRVTYRTRREPKNDGHPYLVPVERAVLHGQEVVRALLALTKEGFVPDVIVGHPGWGETMFVKDIHPHVPYLNYCEFFYGPEGRDFGFDPEHVPSLDSRLNLRTRALPLLTALEACDKGMSPTCWQRDTHPAPFHDKIAVIHDGVDVDRLKPDATAGFALPDGRVLTRADRVVTYVARNLEPYRGFPSFMRAVPRILDAAPDAEILIVGGDEVSYGSKPKGGGTWREVMLAETGVDSPRVHFLGHLPYDRYVAALSVSSAHVYLTYPFVLSWSMLEAMALGCLVVGSDTAPVREVIEDGVNGFLVDFFSPDAIADKLVAVSADAAGLSDMRLAARRTVLERYALADCLSAQMALIGEMVGRAG